VRVSHSIDIPVCIVMEAGGLVPKISVALEELLRGWIVWARDPRWTGVSFVVIQSRYVKGCVSKSARGAIATVFRVGGVEVDLLNKWGRRGRIDPGDDDAGAFVSVDSVPISLLENRAMRTAALILVRDPAHGSLVTHVITAADEWEVSVRTGASWWLFRHVILLIGVIGMRAIAVIDRGEALNRGMSATGAYWGVVVNNMIDTISLTIICINLKLRCVVSKLQVSASRLGHPTNPQAYIV